MLRLLSPSYRLRIDAMLIKEDFTYTLDWIKPAIDAVILTCRGSYKVTTLSPV